MKINCSLLAFETLIISLSSLLSHKFHLLLFSTDNLVGMSVPSLTCRGISESLNSSKPWVLGASWDLRCSFVSIRINWLLVPCGIHPPWGDIWTVFKLTNNLRRTCGRESVNSVSCWRLAVWLTGVSWPSVVVWGRHVNWSSLVNYWRWFVSLLLLQELVMLLIVLLLLLKVHSVLLLQIFLVLHELGLLLKVSLMLLL